MSNKVYVTIELTSKEPFKKEMLKALKNLESNYRKEQGCVHCDIVHICKPKSYEEDGNNPTFLINEIWDSEEAHQKHVSTPEFQQTVSAAKMFLEGGPVVKVWKHI